MKAFVIGLFVALTFATPTGAMQAITTLSVAQANSCTVEFDQDALSLVAANAFRYTVANGASQVNIAVTCSGSASPYQCSTPLPDKSIGQHDITITAAEVLSDGTVLNSSPSAVLSYRISNGPNAPKNLHIKKS